MSQEQNSDIKIEDGKVTMIWDGETVNEFSIDELSKADSPARKEMVKLMQSGLLYNKKAQAELGQLRKERENLNNMFELAKEDDNALALLKTKIEEYVGRPLTAKEEKQVEGGEKPRILLDDEENEKVVEVLKKFEDQNKALKDEVEKLKKARDTDKQQEMKTQIQNELDELAGKYNGKDGNPKFDKEAVLEYAIKNEIKNFENAYKLLNFNELTQATQKKTIEQMEENKKKFENVNKLQKEDTPGKVEEKPSKPKTYRSLGNQILEELKAKGESLVIDD